MTYRYLLYPIVLLVLLGTAPTHAQGLNVFLAASTDAPGAGDAIDYTLMVSNTGPTALNNVRVEVSLPLQIAAFHQSTVIGDGLNCAGTCSPAETAAWEVGTLAPGQSRRLTYATRIAASPPAGDATTTVVASAENVSDVILLHDVAVDPSPLLRLSLVPDSGPAVPGEPFTYTLTYGNVGASTPTEVVLTMPVPAGADFQSATEGGTESGGMVTWPLGIVGVGAGGRVELTVVPEAELAPGATLEAEAELDSGVATELVVRSAGLTEVGPREALGFAYALSQNAVARSGSFAYTLTATNTSTTSDLTDVVAQVRLPEQIAAFHQSTVIGDGLNCAGTCSPAETAAWEVGTLAPGQSRTIIMPTSIAGNAQQGEVLRAFYQVTASGLNEQTGGGDLVVDPFPVTRFRLVPGPAPAVPGEPFTYTLVFGNIGSQPTDVTLRMVLPEASSFLSATAGGTEADGVVTWQASDVAEEAAGRVQVTVGVDADVAEGAILKAVARLDTGSPTEYILHTSTATPVRSGIPLKITYTANREASQPGDPVSFTMVAENEGPANLTDVVAQVRLPEQIAAFHQSTVIGDGLNCAGTCSPAETAAWEVGTLAPGQSRTIIMPTSIAGNAQQGTFLLSPVVATATGSNEVVLHLDVLLGEQVPVSNEPGAAETHAFDVEAYPTPFVRATTFRLSLPQEGEVRLVVYDVLGRAVATLAQEPLPAGRHEVRWNARGLPSGVYFYRLDAPQGVRTGSLVKVR